MLNIGHRGAPRQAPENTLASFNRALELGADGIELDVHLSRDGHAVVIHDRLVDRTTDGTGPVDQFDLADLRRLDAGSHFSESSRSERIPLLDQALDLVPDGYEVQVELKGLTRGLVNEAVRLIEERGLVEQVVVTSFIHTLIRGVKEINPAIRTGALLPRADDVKHEGYTTAELAVGLTKAAGADVILPHYTTASFELFDLADKSGLATGAWTVDDPRDISRMIEIGASRITSNLPDVVAQVISNASAT